MPKIADMPKKNIERAGWAEVAVEAFCKETGLSHFDGFETIGADFIGDLMHLCDMLEIPFEEILEAGRRHYEAETICALCKKPLKAGDDSDALDPICAKCDKEQKT